MMMGYFRVEMSDGTELGKYKYASITEKQKKILREAKDLHIFCCCNDEDLEMKISSDLRIYPANQNMGEHHEKKCPKYIDKNKDELWTIRKTTSKIYYHVAANYATANDYVEKVNLITYERLTSPEYRLPDNYLDFNKKINTTLKYIETSSGDILYNISITNNLNVDELITSQEYFIYGMLASKPKVTPYNKNLLYLDVIDCFGNKKRYYAQKDIYLEETAKLFRGSKNILICGFVYKKSDKSKMLTFSDLCVKSIDDYGIIN